MTHCDTFDGTLYDGTIDDEVRVLEDVLEELIGALYVGTIEVEFEYIVLACSVDCRATTASTVTAPAVSRATESPSTNGRAEKSNAGELILFDIDEELIAVAVVCTFELLVATAAK